MFREENWKTIQRKTFTSIEALCNFLELEVSLREKLLSFSSFPLLVPYRLASKIKKNTLDDPILRQFVPLSEEQKSVFGFSLDPVGDQNAAQSSRCLQKYEGRVLLLPTSACAMHCRFCFRRHFPYEKGARNYAKEIDLIQQSRDIKEVILSGGDPLSLSNREIEDILTELSYVDHVKRIRLHTRFPIGIPERIDSSLLQIFQKCTKQLIFVIHCNHPLELDEDVCFSLKSIQRLGIPVLSQTVLLKGVNDSVSVLQELFEKLADAGILPYYLHQLDKVQGAAHFEVSEHQGIALMKSLGGKISGYALPRFVKEMVGENSKTLIL